jgi:D-alanyl-lipoteichoic acid acyltransferase DltB (MBOAT superfamily)
MPQFAHPPGKMLNYQNLSCGIFLFFIGLFKKVVIADSFSVYATQGFDVAGSLSFFEAWITSLSYTLQIYFDFSGYTDMAIGSAYMLNIKLPMNFDSPYKALNIQDFWRRWHITLSRWLVKYLYIPLGGNRHGMVKTLRNIAITFLLCGLWHGAGWTFVAWGAVHGLGLVIYRLWKVLGVQLPKPVSWGITFVYVNCAWVLFRAADFSDAIKVFKGMFGFGGIVLPVQLHNTVHLLKDYGISFGPWLKMLQGDSYSLLYVAIGMLICILCRNAVEITERVRLNWYVALATSLLAVFSLMWLDKENTFLYFQF